MVYAEFEELRKLWYSDEGVLFEIIKTLNQRETVIIDPYKSNSTIRNIKANAVRYLTMNFKRFEFLENTYNLYGSLCKYPDMPMFSFNRIVRREQMDDFNINFQKYITSYDFLLDIDADTVEDWYSQAVQIKKDLDKFKVPLILKFSGKKGVHFTVEYNDFPDWIKAMLPKDISELFKKFAENYKLINGYDALDIGIFDLRRIAKTPYSVVYPYYFIALPLSDYDFNNFSLEKVSLPYWINNISKIRNRGLLKREGNPEGFGKFIKEYTEDI